MDQNLSKGSALKPEALKPESPGATVPAKQKPGPKSDPNMASAILAAAETLMPYYGYSRMTIRDLAKHSGIGQASIYRHFDSKEVIGITLVSKGMERVHTGMTAILNKPLNVFGRPYTPSFSDPIRPVMTTSEQGRLQSLLIARVMLRHEQTHRQQHPINELTPELAREIKALTPQWYAVEQDLLARAILEGQQRNVFTTVDRDTAAQAMLWATNSLVIEALLPSANSLETDPLERTIRLLLRGGDATVNTEGAPAVPMGDAPAVDLGDSTAGSPPGAGDYPSSSAAFLDKVTRVASLLVSAILVQKP